MCKYFFQDIRSITRVPKGSQSPLSGRIPLGSHPSTSLLAWTHVLAPRNYALSALHNVGYYEHTRLTPGRSRCPTQHTPSSVLGEQHQGEGRHSRPRPHVAKPMVL